MKTITAILCSIFLFFNAKGQENKRINLILTVNEEIVSGKMTAIMLEILDSTETAQKIRINYYPGSLELANSDYQALLSSTTKKIVLSFNYQESIPGEIIRYEIELQKGWLPNSYNILKIYDLSKVKYKKRFNPIDSNHNYTFELEASNGSFYRTKK